MKTVTFSPLLAAEGPIPEAFGALTTLEVLQLQHNEINGKSRRIVMLWGSTRLPEELYKRYEDCVQGREVGSMGDAFAQDKNHEQTSMGGSPFLDGSQHARYAIRALLCTELIPGCITQVWQREEGESPPPRRRK